MWGVVLTGLKWLGTAVGLPFLKWLVTDIILPIIKTAVVKYQDYQRIKKENEELKKKNKEKLDEFNQNPNSDTFNNLP